MARRAGLTITDRVVPAVEVFGQDVPEAPDVPTVERFLLAHLPEPDKMAFAAADAVATHRGRPGRDQGRDARRTLEDERAWCAAAVRRVRRHRSKWVIRRYRLHEVTERMAAGGVIDWTALAAGLGYADQGHFIRDFKNMFGEPPTWYAQRF